MEQIEQVKKGREPRAERSTNKYSPAARKVGCLVFSQDIMERLFRGLKFMLRHRFTLSMVVVLVMMYYTDYLQSRVSCTGDGYSA